MRTLLGFFLFLTLAASAPAKLMQINVEIVPEKDGHWSYDTGVGPRLQSEAELAAFFAKLSNQKDGIWIHLHSQTVVPTQQLIKILEAAKANPVLVVATMVLADPKPKPAKPAGSS